jgi:hypothetical protein
MSILEARDTGESAATRLNEALLKFAPRLSARIQRIAAGIETQGGRVRSTPENLASIAALVAAMRNDFIDDEFLEAITDYVSSFDTISQDVLEAFGDFDDLDPDLVTAIDRTFKQQAVGLLLSPDTYERSLWNTVANGMIYSVAVGAPVNAMLTSLNNIVESGAVTQATAGIVESAPLMLQRTATAAAAESVGAEFFLYQGRPIKTTREFCAEREGKYWHREEIKQWGREAASGDGWPGMVEGTNEQTIFLHLGGWYGDRNSCRHVLLPVPRLSVPRADLDRMREKGFIK